MEKLETLASVTHYSEQEWYRSDTPETTLEMSEEDSKVYTKCDTSNAFPLPKKSENCDVISSIFDDID